MLFSEVYSAYFNTMAALITRAQTGELTPSEVHKIIEEKAFSESVLTILPAIQSGEWPVMNKELQTPIKHPPKMPLTLLQKRWLKTVLTDPRMRLFQADAVGLEDIEPLFSMEDFVFFDRFSDRDPYSDEGYIERFRTILTALREKRRLRIRFRNRNNRLLEGLYTPYRLEYSAKNDKFRLETASGRYGVYLNLGRMESCELLKPYDPETLSPPKRRERTIAFLLFDERNALDRVMLHFSDCRKETVRMDDRQYRVELWYEAQDETEILIRILSFGPMLKVIAPESFIGLIRERLAMQQALRK